MATSFFSYFSPPGGGFYSSCLLAMHAFKNFSSAGDREWPLLFCFSRYSATFASAGGRWCHPLTRELNLWLAILTASFHCSRFLGSLATSGLDWKVFGRGVLFQGYFVCAFLCSSCFLADSANFLADSANHVCCCFCSVWVSASCLLYQPLRCFHVSTFASACCLHSALLRFVAYLSLWMGLLSWCVNPLKIFAASLS